MRFLAPLVPGVILRAFRFKTPELNLTHDRNKSSEGQSVCPGETGLRDAAPWRVDGPLQQGSEAWTPVSPGARFVGETWRPCKWGSWEPDHQEIERP